jgi:hypothetical protein
MSTTWPTCAKGLCCTHIKEGLEDVPGTVHPILPIFRWDIMKNIEDELNNDESQESQGRYVIGRKLEGMLILDNIREKYRL